VELLASLVGLQHGFIPATLNQTDPDSRCGLNVVREPLVPKNSRFLKINVTRLAQASAVVVEGVSAA
jgi:3-oxoacyl-(acyl-carrier-protein) synthase